MRLQRLVGLACLLLVSSTALPAWGQDEAGETAAIVSYPPAFFAQYRPTNALSMLFNLPGFTVDFGADARGYSGNAGNILIDGDRPPEDLRAVLDRLPASVVERIDVVRGGAGGLDMHGKPVIANVIRRKDTGGKASGSVLASGSRDARDGWSGNTAYQVQRTRNGRTIDASVGLDRFVDTDDTVSIRRNPSAAVIRQTIGTGVGEGRHPYATGAFETPWAGGKLRINGNIDTDHFSYDAITRLIIPGGVEVSGDEHRTWHGEVGARYSHALPRGASGELVFVQKLSGGPSTSYYNTPSFTSGTVEDSHSLESVLSGSVSLAKRGPWSVEAGTELAYNRQDSETAFSYNGSAFSLAGDSSVVEELRSETFATATWRPSDKLSVAVGARYENSTITASGTVGGGEQTLAYLKPNLNITWSPNKANVFSLRVERMVDQLSFGGFAASASFDTGIFGIGNPDIRPESTWVVEGRYEYRFDQRGSVLVQIFHRDTSDLLNRVVVLVPDPLGGPAVPYEITRNVGTLARDAISISTTIPLDRYGLKGGMLTTRNLWRTSSTIDPITGLTRKANGENAVEWNFNLSQQIQDSKYAWSIYGNNGATLTNYGPRTVNFNGFGARVGASFSYKPRPESTWTLGFNNLLQRDNPRSFTLFSAPRGTGVVVYDETGRSVSARSVFVTLRQTF